MGQGSSANRTAAAVNSDHVHATVAEDVRRKRRHSDDGDADSAALENIRNTLDTPSKKRVQSTSRYIYETLFVQGKNSDVIIAALGREWNLHRVYMCQAEYFSSMFSGPWEESSKPRIAIEIIDDNITEDALDIVFGALYSEEVKLAPTTVPGVLAAATMFQLRGMVEEVSEFMLETVAPETVCAYLTTAQMYGTVEMEKRFEEWLLLHLLQAGSVALLEELSAEVLLRMLRHRDLFVLQVEMDIYTILKQWLYVQVSSGYSQEFGKLLAATESHFKRRSEVEPDHCAFLDTDEGREYVDIFKALRFPHIAGDIVSCRIIENDGIVPKSWLLDVYREQWMTALASEQTSDTGPATVTDSWFYENAMRYGRILSSDAEYCWRWVGYTFGLDMVVSYKHGRLGIRRNASKYPSTRSIHLQPEHREIVVRARAIWEEKSANNRHTVIKSTDSGRLNFYLRPDEEAVVLTLPLEDVVFPLYISVHTAFTGPSQTN